MPMDTISGVFHRAPEVAVFLSIGLGYLIGKIRIGSFTLGATAGTLLVGLLLGIAISRGDPSQNIQVPDLLKTIFFALFIYAVGFRTGPQFFQSFDRRMISQIVLTIIVTVTGLLCVLAAAKFLKFDAGMAAGLGAGSLTQSAIIGTAGDAITRLGLTPEQTADLQGRVAVGYAVTYVFGTIGIIFFARDIAPRLLGIDLTAASAEYQRKLSGGKVALKPGQFEVDLLRGTRAFRAEAGAGKTIASIEKELANRCVVEQIDRGDQRVKIEPSAVLQAGDAVVIAGRIAGLLAAPAAIGPEISDKAITTVGDAIDVVVTKKDVVGKRIGSFKPDSARGVFLRRIVRGSTEMPVEPEFVLQRGDTLTLIGSPADVARIAAAIGTIERPSDKTDLVYCALGIVMGTIIGLLSVKVAGVPITLGAGGGVLVAGLVFGWLRSLHPTFGNFPIPVQTVFSDLGLNGFIAVVGLAAGPKAIDALKDTGIGLFLAGVVATVVPAFVGLYAGKLMKIDPVVLVGAICGARSANPAIGAVTDYAESSAPAVGFTVPYAIANVLLTVWGPVIVGIMH